MSRAVIKCYASRVSYDLSLCEEAASSCNRSRKIHLKTALSSDDVFGRKLIHCLGCYGSPSAMLGSHEFPGSLKGREILSPFSSAVAAVQGYSLVWTPARSSRLFCSIAAIYEPMAADTCLAMAMLGSFQF